MTPTQRTLAALADLGYTSGMVERWIAKKPFGIRKDLFGIIDIISIKPGEIVGVQSTGTGFSDHLKKLTIEKAAESRAWLESGAKLQLWGWRKLKVKRGGKAMRYFPRFLDITLDDLNP